MKRIKTNFWMHPLVLLSLMVFMLALLVAPQLNSFIIPDSSSGTIRDYQAWEGWEIPKCNKIGGITLLAFTQNDGKTIVNAPKDRVDDFNSSSLNDLTPLRTPNTFFTSL